VTLDDEGKFVAGHVVSTIQPRPFGPSLDTTNGVLTLLRSLTAAAFPDGELDIRDDGTLARRTAP
jgi:hypothetical protein